MIPLKSVIPLQSSPPQISDRPSHVLPHSEGLWVDSYEYPEGGILLIWMDHATFHRYVATYLDTLHITSPTTEQQEQAIQHCRQLSFWHNITDQQVHIRQFGHISKGKRL